MLRARLPNFQTSKSSNVSNVLELTLWPVAKEMQQKSLRQQTARRSLWPIRTVTRHNLLQDSIPVRKYRTENRASPMTPILCRRWICHRRHAVYIMADSLGPAPHHAADIFEWMEG